ncbi:MAG: hypothetical protein LOY58_10950 [Gammaproteobacteria bacterium]|nr:hypothetical protein [Gammaproteobacteria bacterium]
MLESRSLLALVLFLFSGLLMAPFTAQAHTDEHLDAMGGVHGGMLRMSGAYHLELVVDEGAVTVWVMDHGNAPQSTAGARGQLMLLQDGERIIVELEPKGENELRGSDARIAATESPRAVLTLSMSGQPPLQLRFAEIAKPAAAVDGDAGHSHAGH